VLAEYTASTEPFLAKWRHGLGRVYYFGTVNAEYVGGAAIPFSNKIGEAAENIVNITRANCTAISNPKSSDIARTERLVVQNSEILKMVVLTWT